MMPQMEESQSYLETELDAKVIHDENEIRFVFQRAKVKLSDELEIQMLKTINPNLNKQFELTEDQLIITYQLPQDYRPFNEIFQKNVQQKMQLAYNIIKHIQTHSLQRLKLIISPENILFDQGLVPHVLHYGVSESIPPYQENNERLWLETRAIIAVIADDTYDFSTYMAHYETLDLSQIAEQIMYAESYDDILLVIEESIQKDIAYEETVIHIPEKKWKVRRYLTWVLTILFIPTLVYAAFALFFKIPETNAYVESSQHYLKDEYSSVVDTLSRYNHENMPRVVQFELASSYIANESLTDEQRKNIQSTITLQSDRQYYLYWIDIGRGNYREAIDTARLLEDRDLIVYGLLKQRENIKTDQSLSGSEREEELEKIQQEIDEYQQEMEEEKKESEGENNNNNRNSEEDTEKTID